MPEQNNGGVPPRPVVPGADPNQNINEPKVEIGKFHQNKKKIADKVESGLKAGFGAKNVTKPKK